MDGVAGDPDELGRGLGLVVVAGGGDLCDMEAQAQGWWGRRPTRLSKPASPSCRKQQVDHDEKQELILSKSWTVDMFDYRSRVADGELSERLTSIGAVLIDGPKGCGKTETALRLQASWSESSSAAGRHCLTSLSGTPGLDLPTTSPRSSRSIFQTSGSAGALLTDYVVHSYHWVDR